jgi:molybdate transport repressor ModE-like protein
MDPAMRPNTYQLTALAMVVRQGSLTAAAQKLGVSQSAVTQHLQKLEALVGAKILIRGQDGLSLTRTGREVFELAERHVTLDRIIAERLTGFADLKEGHLRIIANTPMPALSLIAKFNARWPDIQIEFTLLDWNTAIEKLRSREADIALIFEPTQSPDWTIYNIGEKRYVLYVPSDHRFARKKSICLSELSNETLLLPELGSLTQRIVSKAMKDNCLILERTIRTTTFPVMKEAILQGVGVGIFLEGSATMNEALACIPIQELPDAYQSCVVVPKDKHDLRLVQSFLSLLEIAS